MRIWICSMGGLGDTLVCLPALNALRRRYSRAHWTLLTHKSSHQFSVTAWDVLQHTGLFSEVIFFQPSRLRDVWAILQRLWTARPDKLYYLSPASSFKQVARDWVLLKLLGRVPNVIGLQASTENRCKFDNQGGLRRVERVSQRLLDLVNEEDVGWPPAKDLTHLLAPSQDDWRRVEALFRQAGMPADRMLVAIGPGSKMPAKRWFPERFREVGRQLLTADPRLGLVVMGGPEDKAAGESLCRAWGSRCLNLAGRTNLMESAVVLMRCVLYVGNDTGTMHLAAAVGIPTVSIFTSRDNPGRWEPFGANHVVLRKELPCSGCMLEVCARHDMACLRQISVEEVVGASLAQLRSNALRRAAS